MSLGNIKHQVTIAVIAADPTSRAVGILKLAGVLKDAGINLATLLTPMTTEAIRGWSNNPEYAKQENESIVATITELPPGAQMMAPQPMMGQMPGMMHDPRFGNPGMYMQPGAGLFPDGNCWNSAPAYAPTPYPASRRYGEPIFTAAAPKGEPFLPTGQSGNGERIFTSNWPTLPGSMTHMKLDAYSTVVSTDPAGSDGLHYRYTVRAKVLGIGNMPIVRDVQEITFQRGDVNLVDGPNGVRVADLLVVCADRLQCCQASTASATPARAQALSAIHEALELLNTETLENVVAANKSGARWS
jgi:hypothetical protein